MNIGLNLGDIRVSEDLFVCNNNALATALWTNNVMEAPDELGKVGMKLTIRPIRPNPLIPTLVTIFAAVGRRISLVFLCFNALTFFFFSPPLTCPTMKHSTDAIMTPP